MINFFDYNGSTSSGGAFVHLSAGEGFQKEFFGHELGMADVFSRRRQSVREDSFSTAQWSLRELSR
ncbi:MAG: hypothetical protein IJG62_07470, partial [Synergistaceae bacterium]|nr:hypothetical protein [Synergistaceae bacterium]